MEDNMRKMILSAATFFLCAALFSATAWADENDTVRVGLYYSGSGSQGALLSANLENYQDTGSGYYFGYYNSNRDFVQLGTTSEKAISMSQDVNLVVNGDGSYSPGTAGGSAVIGCYHLQMDQSYSSYDQAAAAAAG